MGIIVPDKWTDEEWNETYQKHFSRSISDLERFKAALSYYGSSNVYEALVESATRKLEGDPLNYILAVAHSNWKNERQMEEDVVRYEMRIDQAKERTLEQGEKLTSKIEKAKRKLRDGRQ